MSLDKGEKLPEEFSTALISRLNNTGIPIGLKLHGSVVKTRPIKSQQVILGNKTLGSKCLLAGSKCAP